ncbi:MAG: hypothetical protein LBC79_10350 [Deltaproteobacteria bacterium]|jgi:hypothetical protein|nr:hypothetical protein [Deltaproteobacteria bacterium]
MDTQERLKLLAEHIKINEELCGGNRQKILKLKNTVASYKRRILSLEDDVAQLTENIARDRAEEKKLREKK